MNDLSKEVVIDIGGEAGKYFVERAKAETEKTFLVLDPEPIKSGEIPANLYFLQWLSSPESDIPLKDSSIDEANIHFLFGEIIDETGIAIDSLDISEEREAYRNILQQLKRVLKSGGKVNILEVKDNVHRVEELLKEEGFQITSPPQKLENEERTTYSTLFFKHQKRTGRPESESFILPMEIKAVWNP